MYRRQIVRTFGASFSGVITAGCLGNSLFQDTAPSDNSVVKYEALSERGQAFVDATWGRGHTVKWLNRDGDRVYVEYNQSADRWEPVEDPLSLESVDDELPTVYRDRDAYLEKNGQYYEAVVTHGDDGDYRHYVTVTDGDDCDETVTVDELSGFEAALAGVLLEQGEALAAPHEMDPVARADVYFNGTELQSFNERFGHPDGACLEDDEQSVHVEQTGTDLMDLRTYKVNHVDFDQD